MEEKKQYFESREEWYFYSQFFLTILFIVLLQKNEIYVYNNAVMDEKCFYR